MVTRPPKITLDPVLLDFVRTDRPHLREFLDPSYVPPAANVLEFPTRHMDKGPKLALGGAVVPREYLDAVQRTRGRHMLVMEASRPKARDAGIDIDDLLARKRSAMVYMMSRRMISDRLLKSERYMSLPPKAQTFYLHIHLIADDFGLLLWSPLGVRECFGKRLHDAEIKKLMRLLECTDLLRPYEFDGATFAFLPSFDQRLQKLSTNCPLPPPGLYEDDEEAAKKFSENKHKFKNSAGIHGDSRGIRARSEVKGREVEEKKPLRPKPLRPSDDGRDWFELFWKAYPRKVKKPRAQKAWAKLNPDDALAQTILKALELHKATGEWTTERMQFIPHPSTWLIVRRWEDEAPPVITVKPKESIPGWWKSDALTDKKGREIGIHPGGGESYHEYRGRIWAALKKQEEQDDSDDEPTE